MSASSYTRKLHAALPGELIVSPGVAAIIRDEAGCVLITKRADDGSWDIPGGTVEPGETPAKTVVREVREETGLEVRVLGIAGLFGGPDYRHQYPNGDRIESFMVVFDCETTGGTLKSRDGEVAAFRYVAPADLPEMTAPYPPTLFARERRSPIFN